MNLKHTKAYVIDKESCATVSTGPIVMAIDSRDDTPVKATKIDTTAALYRVRLTAVGFMASADQGFGYGKRCIAGNLQVDYATACSLNPGVDEFRLWVPVKQQSLKPVGHKTIRQV